MFFDQEYTTLLTEWYGQLAQVFLISDPNLILAGQEIIKKHKQDFKHTRKYAPETALAIIMHVAKHLKARGWNIDDYISACSNLCEMDKGRIFRSLRVIKGPDDYAEYMMESAKEQLDFVVDHVYQGLLIQLFTSDQLAAETPPEFSQANVKETTRLLLKLGNKYHLNNNKKTRALICAVTCLTAVCLREKIPVKHTRQFKPTKGTTASTFSKRSIVQRKGRKWFRKEESQPIFDWNFSTFGAITRNHYRYIRKIYLEYYNLLRKCVAQLPWLDQPVEIRQVICHLEDILEWFGGPEPRLKLEIQVPISYKRNRVAQDERELQIKRAKEWISRKEMPTKQDSVYAVYCLLVNKYKENDIVRYNNRRLDEEVRYIQLKSEFGYSREEEEEEEEEEQLVTKKRKVAVDENGQKAAGTSSSESSGLLRREEDTTEEDTTDDDYLEEEDWF